MCKPSLTATSVRVTSFRASRHPGGNQQPAGGWATFSDGKHYGFNLDMEGTAFTFSVHVPGQGSRYGLRLPKRSAAIFAALDTVENVDMSPITVHL